MILVLVALTASCTQRDAKNSSRGQSSPAPMTVVPVASAGASSSASDASMATQSKPRPDAGPSISGARALDIKIGSESIDAGPAKPSQSKRSGCRILAIGDSLTDPRSNGGGYLKPWIARCPSCPVTNIARGGAMVNQMLVHLRQHLGETAETYSHWIIFGGVNDLYSDQTAKRTLTRIERDLSTIYALGHAQKSMVVAIAVAPWGGFRRWYTEERGTNTVKLNQWIREQKSSGAIDVFVDSVSPLTCGNPIELCPELATPYHDGLHFGPGGHRKLGMALLDALGDHACD